jgi:hypothetical protein
MYVRRKDLVGIDPKHRPAFRTKLELAVELLRWAKIWLGLLNKPFCVVADGAYAKAAFLKPAKSVGMTVVSRLRKDVAFRTVPGPKPAGRRGRPSLRWDKAAAMWVLALPCNFPVMRRASTPRRGAALHVTRYSKRRSDQ